MFKDNGEVIHFTNPKVQASLGSNTFSISGLAETKREQKTTRRKCHRLQSPFSSARHVTFDHVSIRFNNNGCIVSW